MTDEKQVVVYDITDAAIAKMEDLYMGLTVSGPDDEDGFKAVHKARKVVKTHRVSVEKRRKELKADALAWVRKVDGEANRIKDLLEPIETHLIAQCKIVTDEKKRIEAEEAKAQQEKIDGRMEALAGYNSHYPYNVIESMDDEAFDEHLAKVRKEWDTERARIEAEGAAREEQERIIRETQEAQAKITAVLEAKQAEIDAKEAEIAAEKARIEAEERAKVMAAEAAKRAVEEEKARVEREKKEAEEKAAAEKTEAERVAALLPDKGKAIAWVESMRDSIPKRPAIKDPDISYLIVNTLDQIKAVLDVLHRDIEEA